MNVAASTRRYERLFSPADIGRANRARVLQALCDRGPLSRADLARLCDVPRATIGGVVGPLLESGLLVEGENNSGNGRMGKPSRPLTFGPRSGLSAAVSIHESGCRCALVNARGEILEAKGADFPFASRAVAPEAAAGAIARAVSSIVRGAGSILGVGVAIPGLCDPAGGLVVESIHVPSWTRYGLAGDLERRLRLPAFIDNDSRCAALGEKWFGAGKGAATFAAVQTGEGLGVGLVLNGSVLRGDHGLTGEFGHASVSLDGARCRCGLRGCWETVATLRWLRRRAVAERLPGARQMTGRALSALAADGHHAARALLEEYAENLARGLANLINMLGPLRIILHGDVAGAGENLLATVIRRTDRRTLRHVTGRSEIVTSPLAQDADLLGAAGLVLSETFLLAT